jgi:hypothetical protein
MTVHRPARPRQATTDHIRSTREPTTLREHRQEPTLYRVRDILLNHSRQQGSRSRSRRRGTATAGPVNAQSADVHRRISGSRRPRGKTSAPASISIAVLASGPLGQLPVSGTALYWPTGPFPTERGGSSPRWAVSQASPRAEPSPAGPSKTGPTAKRSTGRPTTSPGSYA